MKRESKNVSTHFMRNILSLVLMICLTSGTHNFADEAVTRSQIQQWVQQLGDDSFLVRQRAESFLIRAGIQAYPELQRARQSHDVEIVYRAEYVLSQIEQAFRNIENQAVALWIQLYTTTPDLASKARCIMAFAPGIGGLSKGEGLQTLCRLVRFEENNSLRLEAVKTMIASPPISQMLRQKWYQHIRDHFPEHDDDELFQCLEHYAKLWCDLNNTESQHKRTATLQERVRQVSADTLQLLENPQNGIPSGSTIDILLHYAVAELQDAVGLIEDRENTIASALAIVPEHMPESILPIGSEDELPMFEHMYVGEWLQDRFRLHWAMAHYQKVMEDGHFLLQVLASNKAAEVAIVLADYSQATAFLDTSMEILESQDYKKLRSDSAQRMIRAKRQAAYCLATKAVIEENWAEVREPLLQALIIPGAKPNVNDMNLVLLAYIFCQQHPEDREFRNRMDQELKKMWQAIMEDYDNIPENIPNTCNSAAWLLANTGGDYQTALTFMETALKAEPDTVIFVDTLAHVYFLGGKVEEAVRTQEQVVRAAPEAVIFRQALERFKKAEEMQKR